MRRKREMSAIKENKASEPTWLNVLKTQIESLRFGTVQVVVHEARVVQIETTEKVRFEKAEPGNPSVQDRLH